MSDTAAVIPLRKKKVCDNCSYEQINIWRGYDYLSMYCENCGHEATEPKPPQRQAVDRSQIRPTKKVNIRTRRYS